MRITSIGFENVLQHSKTITLQGFRIYVKGNYVVTALFVAIGVILPVVLTSRQTDTAYVVVKENLSASTRLMTNVRFHEEKNT